MPNVTVYGADWCPLTKAALLHLDELGVDYDYIDIEQDPEAAKWVADNNGGKEKKPTISVEGAVLSEPSNAELDDVLRDKGVLQ
jgi:glutaredoxin